MAGEELGDLLRVGHVPLDAQAQRLEALRDQERVERRGRRAEVAQQLHPGLQRVRGRAELGEHHTVVARVRRGEAGELAVGPVEGAAVDDHAGDRRAVAAEVLGRRVHDDVGAVARAAGSGTAWRRCCRRSAARPSSCATAATPGMSRMSFCGLEIVSPKNALVFGRTAARHESRSSGSSTKLTLDAELGQRVVEQVVGAAVEPRAGHDVVAGVGEVEDRERLGGLAGGQEQRRDAAFERGDALLDDVLGRVHDPGVDVAGLGQAEQRGGVLGAVERVGRGLVDRQRPRVGGDVGRLAGVDLLGLERPRGAVGSSACVDCSVLMACSPVVMGLLGSVRRDSATTAHAGPPPVFSGGPSQRTRACR